MHLTFKKKLDVVLYGFEDLIGAGGITQDIVCLVISGIALIFSLFAPGILPFDPAWIAIVLCGIPILVGAVVGLITKFDIRADVLVTMALIASICIGEDFAAGEIAFIMQIGSLLEELTVRKTHKGIERLIDLTPQMARVITAGEENMIEAEKVVVGDLLRVLPGEIVPVDGVITKGETSIDQAVMTGESMPVDKGVGDEVSSGTLNQFGAFDMKAVRVGEDSSIQRMVRLVQSADAGKAKIVRTADRWATWIVVIALSCAILTWLISGEIIRAVTILVVFCPCALVLATPTAIMAAIGNATKRGFLTRQGDGLERMSRIKCIAFDKTGTLTYGKPKVIDVVSMEPGWTRDEVLRVAASAERGSEHPLGRAIVNAWDEPKTLSDPQDFELLLGRGISAKVDGMDIVVARRDELRKRVISPYPGQ
ncbi:MAG: HAD-IC family P-type ATPase, partial [Eggerthellaceae bacterium]|nr:HAD-IC family P-type ATPase [Eggerthellaceae bacterium]